MQNDIFESILYKQLTSLGHAMVVFTKILDFGSCMFHYVPIIHGIPNPFPDLRKHWICVHVYTQLHNPVQWSSEA